VHPAAIGENPMSEFMSYLFAIIVVGPLQAEVTERLQGVPVEILQSGRTCVEMEAPRLLRRATEEWGWAAANAIGITAGWVDPVTLLDASNEHCGRLVGALAAREEA